MQQWLATIITALITGGVVLLVAGFGGAVAWGRIKQTLKNYEEKFVAVSDEVSSLKRGLYNPNGTLVYVTVDDCEKRRAICDKDHTENQTSVCKKIDALGQTLHKIQLAMARLAALEEAKNGKPSDHLSID